MPKQGPSEGSRRQLMARLPIRLRPSPRPTVVVVLPSPAGVGLMAVTRMSLPSLFFCAALMSSNDTLALYGPKLSRASAGMPIFLPISAIGFIFASRAISISDFTAMTSLLRIRADAVELCARFRCRPGEGVAGLDACRLRPFGGRHLLAIATAHAFRLDGAPGSRDRHAVGIDAEDFARFAAARHLARIEDIESLAVDGRPGTRRRVRRPDEIVTFAHRLRPLDLGNILLEPALIGLLCVILRQARGLAGAHQVDAFHDGIDAEREQLLEINIAQRLVGADLDLLLQQDRAFIQALVGPEDRQTGLGATHRNGPVDRGGAAVQRRKGGVILEGGAVR